MSYKDLYNENADFKAYVDKYVIKHEITVDEALNHSLVQNVGKDYYELSNSRLECKESAFDSFKNHISNKFETVN